MEQSYRVPSQMSYNIIWLGFLALANEKKAPVVHMENGSLMIHLDGIWMEIKRSMQRVYAVEMDRVWGYNERAPHEEDARQEEGFDNCLDNSFILMKAVMRMIEPRSRAFEALEMEYERKVMRGLKVAVSEKNRGLALDYAGLMTSEAGFRLAAITAKKLGEIELAERIEILGMEKEGARKQKKSAVVNPVESLLDNNEDVDLNNIRLKYGLGHQKKKIDASAAAVDSELGYSGSSFSF